MSEGAYAIAPDGVVIKMVGYDHKGERLHCKGCYMEKMCEGANETAALLGVSCLDYSYSGLDLRWEKVDG